MTGKDDMDNLTGEAAAYMMLALWCAGYDTRDIAYALAMEESHLSKMLPKLLRRRRLLQLQSVE